jgi:hypothetical protein
MEDHENDLDECEADEHVSETDEPEAGIGSADAASVVDAEVSYSDAVQSFMELALNNTIIQAVDLKNDPQS